MQTKHFAVLLALFLILSFYVMGSGVLDLLYYAFRSFIRMVAAYAISIVFSFVFGLLIIHNKRAYEYVFPIVDVLQAIPILGFLPFAMLVFEQIFPGSILGPEFSSVFLIFTSMTWAVLFAVVESGASITNEIRDLAKILNLNGMRYLTQVVLPISFPQFVSGSIAGWGGGWYFLVAAEYLSWGNQPVKLPGLGSFISQSAFHFDIIHSVLGVAMLAFVVFGMNIYVWQPLLYRARSFSSKPLVGEEREAKEGSDFLMGFFGSAYGKLKSAFERMHRSTEAFFTWLRISPAYSTSHEKISNKVAYLLTGSVFVIFVCFLFFRPPSVEGFSIVSFVSRSVLRILIAFSIALAWTAAVAIFLARNKRAMNVLMPVFDLGQSIPAVSIFPVMVVLVVETIGKAIGIEIGLEVASILLVLTGMQWYLLFNLIRAVQNIPDEILDLSNLFSLRTLERLRHIMVPAIMPAVFVGGLEAMGGGWNASIVSEYIISPAGTPYAMPGVGFLLSKSSAAGDMNGVILAVCAITLLILIPHQLIWKPMVRESYRYKF
ncbi:Binding-protein-dependent transport system inner membrane component [uncultured archaeon]|nr:Binding-protein-dependent transport system inner membrane component [uncultured archaeon]